MGRSLGSIRRTLNGALQALRIVRDGIARGEEVRAQGARQLLAGAERLQVVGAYSIMSRIACLSPWRVCFRSEAAHALAPASSAAFALDRFWTSFGPEAPRFSRLHQSGSTADAGRRQVVPGPGACAKGNRRIW